MTLSPWIIYLWGIADGIINLSIPLAMISGCCALLLTIFIIIEEYENNPDTEPRRTLERTLNYLIATLVAASLVAMLTPSSKTIAIMVVAPAIVNSKPVQEDMPELYTIAIEAMKERLSPKK